MLVRRGQCARLCREVDLFRFDMTCVDLPVANAFEPGEALLRRLDRPFPAAGLADDDRALATAKQPAATRYLVDETDAVDRHATSSLFCAPQACTAMATEI